MSPVTFAPRPKRPSSGTLRSPSAEAVPPASHTLSLSTVGVLRWLYLGRLALVGGILAAAFLSWTDLHPNQTLFATLIFVVALVTTGISFWWSHASGRPLTPAFTFAQTLLDGMIVTGVVHLTGSVESPLAPLYVLVITGGALVLPISGGVLAGALTTGLFVVEAVFFSHGEASATISLQASLFGVIAVTVGLLADRLRKGGSALGELESELRQLRLDTGDILDNIRSGILTVDQEGRLLYMNPVGERVLGMDGTSLFGRPILGALNDVAPGMGDVIRRSIDERRSVARFRTRTGDHLDPATLGVSTTVLERDSPGPYPVTAIFQDITDVERLEESNRRNSRLEAVTALSASLAHEIKNPLASIQSAVEQLAVGELDPADRQLLRDLVVRESQRLSRLLSEFIDFSALEVGRRTEFSTEELVDEALALVRQHPDAQEVAFEVGAGQDPLSLVGDRDLIHRALFNLLLNAAQFTGSDGRVLVEVGRSADRDYLMGGPGSQAVKISISDTGPGVDVKDLSRIFDPFYTKRQGGSGLGLAVVHRTVEAHDGSVFVEPVSGGGARFVLVLPGTDSAK